MNLKESREARPLRTRRDIPHIWLFEGYYRVSRFPAYGARKKVHLWNDAHQYACAMTTKRRERLA